MSIDHRFRFLRIAGLTAAFAASAVLTASAQVTDDHDHADHQDAGDHVEGGGSDEPILDDHVNPLDHILRLEPAIVDFGEMHRGETQTRTVRITNVSDRNIYINRAFGTCGCAVASFPTYEMAPGDSDEVTVEYNAKNVGRSTSIIRLFLAGNLGDARIAVRSNVLPPIHITPSIYDSDLTEDIEVTLTSSDGTPFRLMAFDPGVFEGFDRESRVTHDLILSAAKLKQAGMRRHRIRIYTDHPRIDSVLLKSNHLDTRPEITRLHNWAIGRGDLVELATMVEEGLDIHETDPQGRNALMLAAQNGQVERVRALLDFGADISHTARDGQTALMKGAQAVNGSPELLQLLIDAGSDVNATDRFNRTALYWAAPIPGAERLQMLIDRGADVNARGPARQTALMAAIKSKNLENVKVIAEAGASANVTDTQRRSPLDYAKILLVTTKDEAAVAEVNEIIRYVEGLR